LENYLKKYGNISFLIYGFIGVIPIFMYETISNESFFLAFKYLSIPFLLIALYTYVFKLPLYRRKIGGIIGESISFLGVLVVTSMLLLFSGGYVMGLNVIVGEQKQFELIGKVVELDTYKDTNGGRSYYAYIKREGIFESTKLDVTHTHFIRLKVGDIFSETWLKGSFGLLYKKR
jgi:hypothetical protein